MPVIATLTAAAVTAGTAVYSSNQANKANKNALNAQNQATDKSLEAQQAALDRITQINQPFINAGSSVLPGLQARVNQGAPNFSAPSYALPLGTHAQPQQPAAPQGAPQAGNPAPVGVWTAGGGNAGYTALPGPSMDKATGVAVDPASAGPQAPAAPQPQATPQPDIAAYLAANPDVAAVAQQGMASGAIGPNGQWKTPEEWAAFQYQNTGQSEGRQMPMTAATPATQVQDPNAQPAQPLDLGTASPVVADYTRPDQGQAPNAADFLNGANFTASPGYQWRLQQGQRNLNANFGAKGLLQSGSAIQGAIDYGQNQASNEYNNWFNQQNTLYNDTANQFNINRNNTNNNFAEDRSYGTNLAVNNRDFANSQYNTQTQNMFQLAGIGTQAAGAISGANSSYGNNAANLYTNQGNNAANAAYNQGSAQQQLAGTLGSTAANLFSSIPRYSGGTSGNIGTAAQPSYAGGY